jgi:hypothetical protein
VVLIANILKYFAAFGAGRMSVNTDYPDGLIIYTVEREIRKNRDCLNNDEIATLREYDKIIHFKENFNMFMEEQMHGPVRRMELEAMGKTAEQEADMLLSKHIIDVRSVTEYDKAARHAVNIFYHARKRSL